MAAEPQQRRSTSQPPITAQVVTPRLPFSLRCSRCLDAVLAPELLLVEFFVAQLSELVGTEGLGCETLSPTGAARERSRPTATHRVHIAALVLPSFLLRDQ